MKTSPTVETQRRVTRLVAAVAENDGVGVELILRDMSERSLRELAVALAAQVRYLDTDAEVIASILRRTAQRFGTMPGDLLSESRRAEDIEARAVASYAARLCGATYSFIGRQLGRDHTTVMHSCGRVGESHRLRLIAQQIAEEHGWSRENKTA